jgi:hypothetical protein
MSSYLLNTRDKPGLLAALVQALAGEAHISFEGDLSQSRLRQLPGVSDAETPTLRRNTTSPRQDFLVLPLETGNAEAILDAVVPTAPSSTACSTFKLQSMAVSRSELTTPSIPSAPSFPTSFRGRCSMIYVSVAFSVPTRPAMPRTPDKYALAAVLPRTASPVCRSRAAGIALANKGVAADERGRGDCRSGSASRALSRRAAFAAIGATRAPAGVVTSGSAVAGARS